jgi:hypothetical protein
MNFYFLHIFFLYFKHIKIYTCCYKFYCLIVDFRQIVYYFYNLLYLKPDIAPNFIDLYQSLANIPNHNPALLLIVFFC